MTGMLRDSGSFAQQIAALASANQSVSLQVGQVTDVTAGVVTVNTGGVAQAGLFTLAPVDVGDNVLIVSQKSGQGVYSYVIGPISATSPPILGTVASVPTNSFMLPVTTAVGTVSAGFIAGYSPAAGDTVWLAWLGTQPVIVGQQGKTGSPPPPTPKPPPVTPPPPPAKPVTGTSTFAASSSGTWRSGDGWRDDANGNVIQGTAPGYGGLNDGAWFYNGRVHSSLAGATVTDCKIWLGRVSGGNDGNQTVHLERISQSSRPGGNVSFTGDTASAALDIGDHGWFDVPNAFGQALVDSGGSVGVHAPSGPYVRLQGVSNSGSAGALRISWRR